MCPATNHDTSSKRNLEEEPLKTPETSSDSSAINPEKDRHYKRGINPLLEYGLKPYEDRIEDLFNRKEAFLESHQGIIATAMEIGLTVLENSPGHEIEARNKIWEEYGQDNKLKEVLLEPINIELGHTGLPELDPEDYTIEEVEIFWELLFREEGDDQ